MRKEIAEVLKDIQEIESAQKELNEERNIVGINLCKKIQLLKQFLMSLLENERKQIYERNEIDFSSMKSLIMLVKEIREYMKTVFSSTKEEWFLLDDISRSKWIRDFFSLNQRLDRSMRKMIPFFAPNEEKEREKAVESVRSLLKELVVDLVNRLRESSQSTHDLQKFLNSMKSKILDNTNSIFVAIIKLEKENSTKRKENFDLTELMNAIDAEQEKFCESVATDYFMLTSEQSHAIKPFSKKNNIYIVDLPDVIISMILSCLQNKDQLNVDNAMTNHHIRSTWVQSFYQFYGKKFRCDHRICGTDGQPRGILQGSNPGIFIVGNEGKTESLQIWRTSSLITCIASFQFGQGVIDMIPSIENPDIVFIATNYNMMKEFNLLTKSFQSTIQFPSFAGIYFSVHRFIQLFTGLFVFGSSTGALLVWNYLDSKQEKFFGHGKAITCLLDLEDSINGISCFASGAEDKMIKIWNTNTQECLHVFEGHTNTITSLLFDKDHGLLISSSLDKTIKAWMLATYQIMLNLTGHAHPVTCLLRLQDGRIAAGSSDKTIRIWNIFSQYEEPVADKILIGTSFIKILYQLSDGRLVSGHEYGGFSIWDMNQDSSLFTSLSSNTQVRSVLQTHDGKLAIGTDTGLIRIWNLITNQCEMILNAYPDASFRMSVNIQSMCQLTEERLAASCYPSAVKIFNLNTGICEHTIPRCDACVNLSDFEIVTIESGEKLQIWNLNELSSKTPIKEFIGLSRCSYDMIRLQDGRLLTSSQVGRLSLCDPTTGKISKVGCPCWSSKQLCDGRIVTGGNAGIICVWILTDSTLTQQSTMQVENPKLSFGFLSLVDLSDGYIATGKNDGSIYIWNNHTQKCVRKWKDHSTSINSIIQLSDKRIVSAAGDVKIWKPNVSH